MSGVSRGTFRPAGSPNLLPERGMQSTELDMTKDGILKVAPEAGTAVAADGTTARLSADAGQDMRTELAVQDTTLIGQLDRLIGIQQQILDLLNDKLG